MNKIIRNIIVALMTLIMILLTHKSYQVSYIPSDMKPFLKKYEVARQYQVFTETYGTSKGHERFILYVKENNDFPQTINSFNWLKYKNDTVPIIIRTNQTFFIVLILIILLALIYRSNTKNME